MQVENGVVLKDLVSSLIEAKKRVLDIESSLRQVLRDPSLEVPAGEELALLEKSSCLSCKQLCSSCSCVGTSDEKLDGRPCPLQHGIKGSATSIDGLSFQNLWPGEKGKRFERRKRSENLPRVRRGKQTQGGRVEDDCYEERTWDPKVMMPALTMMPIAHVKSCFPRRNGCPRQGSVVPSSRAKLDIVFGTNPHHSLEGLEDFSHVWILFVFDGNGTNYCPRPHIYPPRLLGASKGVFATRSPHRPYPIGISLCKLEKVDGRTLVLSGVDLVEGTPVIDIKPYIPCYDAPYANGPDGSQDFGVDFAHQLSLEGKALRYPSWCVPSAQPILKVEFTEEAEKQFEDIQKKQEQPRMIESWALLKQAAVQVLQADPRSVYRKESCVGQQYPFYLDCTAMSCMFHDDRKMVTVHSIEIVPLEIQMRSQKAEVKGIGRESFPTSST